MIDPVIKAGLSAILAEAAELARAGDVDKAAAIRDAHDTIKRELCQHDGGTYERLWMSGKKACCRMCGQVLADAS